MTTQRSADIISGIFLAAIGAVVMVAAFDIKSVFGERLPPRTLPLTLGAITFFSGILLSLRAYFYKGELLFVEWPDREGWVRNIVTFICLSGYLVLIEVLGITVASLIFSFALTFYLDRRWIRDLCVSIAIAIVIQVVFVRILQLSFPPGFWAH
ncbi:MAG: tripartite tricarboxylate transporter TctB family protein [Desulfomonile tiedjei]|nr:tripartite tricarboxylate transporter TctB family protein [Desulfomonile tiedjei]